MGMKHVIGLVLLLGLGYYVYSYVQKRKVASKTTDGVNRDPQTGGAIFSGPDQDPITGAYTAPGVKAGTVGFTIQPID